DMRQEVRPLRDCSGCSGAGTFVPFTHSFQEGGFVASVGDDVRIGDPRQKSEQSLPNPLLIALVVGPEAVLNGAFPGSNANTNQVEEIPIRKSFDIEINRRTVKFKLAEIDCMDPVFPNRKRSQRMVIFFTATMCAPRPPTWAERVGQLSYCKDTP